MISRTSSMRASFPAVLKLNPRFWCCGGARTLRSWRMQYEWTGLFRRGWRWTGRVTPAAAVRRRNGEESCRMLEDRCSRSAMRRINGEMAGFYRVERMCNASAAGRGKAGCRTTHKTRRYGHQQWYESWRETGGYLKIYY